MKLLSGADTKLSSPIWHLPGVVDGLVIKPHALASDKRGTVYVADGVNNRVLTINSLTGAVLNILLLPEEYKMPIDSLLWSDTEPNLIMRYDERIITFAI